MADAKRAKTADSEAGDAAAGSTDLAELLDRLGQVLRNPGGEDGQLDSLVDQLGRLQQGGLDVSKEPAFKAIAAAEATLQAAIVALQAAVDRLTPPPGYRPPAPGDAAYVRSLLSYAHRLSYSSAAPLGYQPGQPLYFFKPPAPQEGEMRVSQLHTFAREWEEQQQRKAQQAAAARGGAAVAAPAVPAAAAPAAKAPAPAPAADLGAQALQHGLDVQQLLASMPAGWKPGDPIPQLGAAAPAAGAAAGAAAAGAAAAPAAPVAPAAVAPPGTAAPRLAGIFLNELSFEEFEYVSDEGGDDSSSSSSGDEDSD